MINLRSLASSLGSSVVKLCNHYLHHICDNQLGRCVNLVRRHLSHAQYALPRGAQSRFFGSITAGVPPAVDSFLVLAASGPGAATPWVLVAAEPFDTILSSLSRRFEGLAWRPVLLALADSIPLPMLENVMSRMDEMP